MENMIRKVSKEEFVEALDAYDCEKGLALVDFKRIYYDIVYEKGNSNEDK